jgi:DNA-binding transcriptional regulator YdaS (Cro superfamily)
MTQITRYEALIRCRDAAGSDSAFARDLSEAHPEQAVTQPRVWRWVNQAKQLPAEYVLTAERLYGVSRHDLRPDIYPREIMVDQGIEDRFCGIDLRARGRREGERRKVA